MAQVEPHREAPGSGQGPRRLQLWFLGSILALALVWALRSAASVAIPVACSLLVALAVWPICRRVRGAVPGRLEWLGTAAAMIVVIAFLGLFAFGLALAGRQVAELGSGLVPQLQEKLGQIGMEGSLGGGLQVEDAMKQFGSRASRAVSTAFSLVAGIVLVLFLILLMLGESRNWREKVDEVSGGREGRDWSQIAATVGEKFRTFFLTRLLLGAITALLYVGWLALFGIDYLLLWGLLAVLLNFLPTIGSIVAGALPVLFAVVQRDVGTAALVAGGLLVIEQVMGNYVDPRLMGRQLALSPLVVLVSLLFWGWVWGIAGAFLAVPMTVLVLIVFAHVEALRPIALLLSNERSMAGLERHLDRG